MGQTFQKAGWNCWTFYPVALDCLGLWQEHCTQVYTQCLAGGELGHFWPATVTTLSVPCR